MEKYTPNCKKYVTVITEWFHERLAIDKYPIIDIENWLIDNSQPGKFYIQYSKQWKTIDEVMLFLDNEEAMTLFKLTWL